MLILLFAFLAGLVTVLLPCVLPVLPLVLAGGAVQGRLRPWGIIFGVVLAFSVFTLALSWAVQSIGLSPNFARNFGITILALLGVAFLVPGVMERLEGWMSRRMSRTGGLQQRHGFGGGLVLGVSLGAVWTPCAGPILASVVAAAQTGSVSGQTVAVTVAYAIGAALPLGLIAGLGQRVMARVRALAKHGQRIQMAFGVVILAMALAMATNLDRRVQAWVISATPNWLPAIQQFEENIDMPSTDTSKESSSLTDLGPAPELAGITGWINSEPTTLAALRGKVVLVKFWTYSCINCIRTLPYIRAWYDAYHDDGFEIIAVHTPEFAFETVPENVDQAVRDFGIAYPVALDPDYKTWNAYKNRYWPAEYLVDAAGRIRYTHFGEGAYGETEQAIQDLLQEAGHAVVGQVTGTFNTPFRIGQSPETYFGTARAARFASAEHLADGTHTYTLDRDLAAHYWALEGEWAVDAESARAGAGSALSMRVRAKEMYVVMAGADADAHPVRVFVDGAGGLELAIANTAQDQTLYRVAQFPEYGEHAVRLEFPEGGVRVYAATFSGEEPSGLACGADGKCDVLPVE
jgi:cytochrome c biogenesis protein CcdA/thiol-disulfide isomerase/thioredoxin